MSDMHTERDKAFSNYKLEEFFPATCAFQHAFESAWATQQKVIDELKLEMHASLIGQGHRLGSKIEILEDRIKCLLGTIRELSK